MEEFTRSLTAAAPSTVEAYRRDLVKVLAERVLANAAARARQ